MKPLAKSKFKVQNFPEDEQICFAAFKKSQPLGLHRHGNGVVCAFEEHRFNETQQVTLLDEGDLRKNPNAVMALAKIMREMAGWLAKNHYSKVL